jgi:hypothetical protein
MLINKASFSDLLLFSVFFFANLCASSGKEVVKVLDKLDVRLQNNGELKIQCATE